MIRRPTPPGPSRALTSAAIAATFLGVWAGLPAIHGLAVPAAAAGRRPTIAPLPQAVPQVAGYLDLVAARIHEEPPFEPEALPNRRVVFTLTVSGQPSCSRERARLEYAFLLDTDASSATGVNLPALPEIGAEAKVAIRCDPGRGRFTSPVGSVSTRRSADSPGAYDVELRTRLGDLPARAFRWIALSKEAETLVRIPEPGRTMPWQVYEERLW